MTSEVPFRERLDPLHGFWLCLGACAGWFAFALAWPGGLVAAFALVASGLGLACSRGARLAVIAGLALQVALFARWESAPDPRDRTGEFRVVVRRATAPGKGVCQILSSPDPGLDGREIRCVGGRPGDTLHGVGELRALRQATNPGGFEARAWGASAGIEGFLRWRTDAPPEVRRGRASVGERLRAWTESVIAGTLRKRLDPAAAALWTATLLARNDALPRSALESFRQSGLFHMLAVSGFHMAVLGGGLVVLLSLARTPRRIAWVAAALVVIAYAWLLRVPPPVARSATAFAALAAAMATGRRPHAGNALFLAAAVLVAWDPNIPFQMGAQLTFAATAALLWGTPALLRWLPARARGGRFETWFAAPVCASLAASAATAPLLAWHVGVVSWIGIPAGLVTAAVFAAGFLASLATVVLGGLPAWCSWGFAGAAEGCARLVYEVALRAGEWAPGRWITGRPSPAVLGLGLLALVLGAFTVRRRWTGRIAVVLAMLGLVVGGLVSRSREPEVRIVFLDVGQGNAALVRWPSGRHWLLDAGPGARTPEGRDAGRDAILPALRILGIGSLDAVVVTHADFDHYGGLEALRRELPPANLFLSADSGTPASVGFDSLAGQLAADGWRFHRIGAGQKLTYRDGAVCQVLAPGYSGPVPRNQASLVLRFSYDTARALVAGDADSISEDFQIASGEPLRSQILLVGHHGSKHSSSLSWLRLVEPREAVLSYGRTNRYGHPHDEVLARLDTVGARIRRTPDGAVVARLSARGAAVEETPVSRWRGPWRRHVLSLPVPWI